MFALALRKDGPSSPLRGDGAEHLAGSILSAASCFQKGHEKSSYPGNKSSMFLSSSGALES